MNPEQSHPISRSKAWVCTVTNLAVFPGLGSLIAGRFIGIVQMALCAVGFVILLIGSSHIVENFLRGGELPTEIDKEVWLVICGSAIVLASWLWALVTSVSIVRLARSE